MVRKSIILDCDPGVDDAVAILLALAAPDELDVLAITTVAGNVGLSKTTRNACMLREIAGRPDVPIYAGRGAPLIREPVAAAEFHGAEGLGDIVPFEPFQGVEGQDAVAAMTAILSNAAAHSICIAVTGPLTNIAEVLLASPSCKRAIAQIVLMGGARREGGNITASAEYNMYADPDAAQVIMEAGCPLVVIGLDATHQVRATPARVDTIARLANPRAEAAASTLHFSNQIPGNLDGTSGAPLHDPCVIGYLLRPDLFDSRPAHIAIETVSDLTRGHSSVEFRDGLAGPFNAQWVTRIDADGLFALLEERLGQ